MGLAGITLSLVVLYAEWLLIRENFFNFINPIVQIEAVIAALFYPVTWAALGVMLIGYVLTLANQSKA